MDDKKLSQFMNIDYTFIQINNLINEIGERTLQNEFDQIFTTSEEQILFKNRLDFIEQIIKRIKFPIFHSGPLSENEHLKKTLHNCIDLLL